MTGELWRSTFQIGVETVYGTDVAATRKMYFDPAGRLARERPPRPHKFATGTRDNQRAFTHGPEMASGNVSMPLSASEILELLLMSIDGSVAPTTPGGATLTRLWTFKPGATLKSATLEWQDGARAWQMVGSYANSLRIAGNVRDQTTVTADLFGKAISAAALTGSLTDRTPDFIEGWETKLYVDALGATPGTTNIPGTLISWDVNIQNNLGRKFFADNVNAVGAVTTGELAITATLVFEASAAAALTAFNDWDAQTLKLVRLDFGNNDLIETTLKKFVTVDIPGAWAAFDMGGSDEGTRAYSLTLDYVYDPVLSAGVQIRAQNSRAAAWT